MKKVTLIFVILCLALGMKAQVFDFGQMRAGGGLSYVDKVGNLGINVNGVYTFNPQWEAAAAFTYTFEKNNVSYKLLDIDVHSVFYEIMSKVNFYVLTGLCFNFYEMETNPADGVSTPGSGSDSGLNIGAGINYKLTDRLNATPEVRYTLFDAAFYRFGASIQYLF